MALNILRHANDEYVMMNKKKKKKKKAIENKI